METGFTAASDFCIVTERHEALRHSRIGSAGRKDQRRLRGTECAGRRHCRDWPAGDAAGLRTYTADAMWWDLRFTEHGFASAGVWYYERSMRIAWRMARGRRVCAWVQGMRPQSGALPGQRVRWSLQRGGWNRNDACAGTCGSLPLRRSRGGARGSRFRRGWRGRPFGPIHAGRRAVRGGWFISAVDRLAGIGKERIGRPRRCPIDQCPRGAASLDHLLGPAADGRIGRYRCCQPR